MKHKPILNSAMILITVINLLGCTGESTPSQLKKSDASYTQTIAYPTSEAAADNDMNFITLNACQTQESLIAFSTAPNSITEDNNCNNHLAANIKLPGLNAEGRFKWMRIGVNKKTGSEQMPCEFTVQLQPKHLKAATEESARLEVVCSQPVTEKMVNVGTF